MAEAGSNETLEFARQARANLARRERAEWERINRRTRAIERQAAALEYLGDSFDRMATAVENLSVAQAVAASKVGSYGWDRAGLDVFFDWLWKRLPR